MFKKLFCVAVSTGLIAASLSGCAAGVAEPIEEEPVDSAELAMRAFSYEITYFSDDTHSVEVGYSIYGCTGVLHSGSKSSFAEVYPMTQCSYPYHSVDYNVGCYGPGNYCDVQYHSCVYC